MRKHYVLDANILIHDPKSLFQFADNDVVIPVGVLGELDRFKKEQTARGFNARAVVRQLDALRGEKSLAAGVPLDGGGSLRVYCEPERVLHEGNGHADIEILRIARRIQDERPGSPVVIVTKDINLRIRADAVGLRAEDYESDHVELSVLYTGQSTRTVSRDELAHFRSDGWLPAEPDTHSPNEYVLLRCEDGEPGSALARVTADRSKTVPIHIPDQAVWGIKARNKEQYFAVDAVLDEAIKLVTLMGKAGTGKTLLGLAAALHQTIRTKRYRSLLVCRPIFPVGRDIGYLPGDVEQKLDPWLKPVADTVDYLLDIGGPAKGAGDCAALMRAGILEIQPLTYIRGRSIINRFVVIDEAQNLTPLEAKTIITRIGQGSKVVLTGDTYQIDNPYVDAASNGFSHLVNRFRGEAIAAHVELLKGERSELAELAANLL